jgi:hypothetical protein
MSPFQGEGRRFESGPSLQGEGRPARMRDPSLHVTSINMRRRSSRTYAGSVAPRNFNKHKESCVLLYAPQYLSAKSEIFPARSLITYANIDTC